MTQNTFHDANNELFPKSEYLSFDSFNISNKPKENRINYNCYDYVEIDTEGHNKYCVIIIKTRYMTQC